MKDVVLSSSFQNSNSIRKDGLLYNFYVGDQSVATLLKTSQDLTALVKELRMEHKNVFILTNIQKLGKVNLQARIFAVDFIKTMDFDKVAIFGNRTFFEQIANVIITASGRGYKMRYFSSESEAKKWLQE